MINFRTDLVKFSTQKLKMLTLLFGKQRIQVISVDQVEFELRIFVKLFEQSHPRIVIKLGFVEHFKRSKNKKVYKQKIKNIYWDSTIRHEKKPN